MDEDSLIFLERNFLDLIAMATQSVGHGRRELD